nr:hypothetical protein [Angustibacter aerolatus]
MSKTNGRVFETGWSTGKALLTSEGWTPHAPGAYQYGGGGGTSRVFKQPGYQQGVVPAAIAQRYAKAGGRALPDVAALGDPNTGMLVGETQTFPDGTAKYSEYRIGGTSLASPLFAGVMAIADQVAGFSHGFANPALYQARRHLGRARHHARRPQGGRAGRLRQRRRRDRRHDHLAALARRPGSARRSAPARATTT